MTVLYSIPDIPKGQFHRREMTVTRSRFLISLFHISSPDAARIGIDRIREEFPDATHHCWAYVAGPAGDTGHIGCSDDGEPHGTAGRPMLSVLLHSGIGEICAVATRWFGGTKLGVGGLVRAYQGVTSLGLESLAVRPFRILEGLEIVVEYAFAERVRRLLASEEAEIMEEKFDLDAHFIAAVPKEKMDRIERLLTDLTAGCVLLNRFSL
ncbi:MAG: YigZ family protein [Desulfovibrionaceae bacterium]|nr:YigZ family protein [Desulfovibrionaceae bacterium]